jgi:hypothetical protein
MSERELAEESVSKRFLYTGKEQRREAKENYEEKCERKFLSAVRHKPRWCPELSEWAEWNKVTSGDGLQNKPSKPVPGQNPHQLFPQNQPGFGQNPQRYPPQYPQQYPPQFPQQYPPQFPQQYPQQKPQQYPSLYPSLAPQNKPQQHPYPGQQNPQQYPQQNPGYNPYNNQPSAPAKPGFHFKDLVKEVIKSKV